MDSTGLVLGLVGEATALAGVSALAYRFNRANRKEAASAQRLREIFARFVDPRLVTAILKQHDPAAFLGRNTRVSILYCRIWSFQPLVERMPNNEVIRYLNEFYALTGSTIHKYGGIIDRFLDDGIVAYFGSPANEENQEERALRASLQIVRYVHAMEQHWVTAKRRPLRVGIGLNTGRVIVGETGFRHRRDFVIIGREVLLAAKLQEATETYGMPIIASPATYVPMKAKFEAIPAEKLPLNGLNRLHDAYIIQSAKQTTPDEDTLTLPPPSEIMTTTIAPDDPLPSGPPPGRRVITRTKQAFSSSHGPTHFEANDDVLPAMPDPPRPIAIYEDDDGPPLELTS
jgi:class 3 adenylate cyclase